ncbi:hypothetical protein J8273_6948 [Carpediemonas membranifera]|uniref:Uncharacterized protein n=1 Tax=Carpediemonas membranifera TaxID=201153 RepID=A0A8J6AXD1_9EUKA|nr:hypothetical protein J8273_6948 [Carpediemonas membranifera]|eukprot:KAG9390708.1 hypothetical protein J8273_6948 [Carpediemonas membranifera]
MDDSVLDIYHRDSAGSPLGLGDFQQTPDSAPLQRVRKTPLLDFGAHRMLPLSESDVLHKVIEEEESERELSSPPTARHQLRQSFEGGSEVLSPKDMEYLTARVDSHGAIMSYYTALEGEDAMSPPS